MASTTTRPGSPAGFRLKAVGQRPTAMSRSRKEPDHPSILLLVLQESVNSRMIPSWCIARTSLGSLDPLRPVGEEIVVYGSRRVF